MQAPFYFGAGMTAIAIGSLWFYRSSLVAVPEPASAALPIPQSAIEETEERARRPADERSTLVLAVGGPSVRRVSAMTVPLARAHGTTVHGANGKMTKVDRRR